MDTKGINSSFYKLLEWITKLAYLNMLWILFTIMGLIIFGLFPSTVSMFAIIRKWNLGEMDIPIFRTFWDNYKSEFIKANILGVILLFVGFVLYFDLRFLYLNVGWIQILYYPTLMITFIYLLVCLNIFPIYVHYDVKIVSIIKNSFINIIVNFLSTILMLIGCIAAYYLFSYIPGLIPFFSGSIIAFILVWSFFISFNKKSLRKVFD